MPDHDEAIEAAARAADAMVVPSHYAVKGHGDSYRNGYKAGYLAAAALPGDAERTARWTISAGPLVYGGAGSAHGPECQALEVVPAAELETVLDVIEAMADPAVSHDVSIAQIQELRRRHGRLASRSTGDESEPGRYWRKGRPGAQVCGDCRDCGKALGSPGEAHWCLTQPREMT